MKKEIVIYQGKNGEISLKGDTKNETIWASLQQISNLFGTDKSGISRHISNIYTTGELDEKSTVAKFATVQFEGQRKIKREIEYYNLDLILSVGYRVNSKVATKFRQWANKTLKEHITRGFTLNPNRIEKNYQTFIQAIEDIKFLIKDSKNLQTNDVLELIKSFSYTWFSLESYDKGNFPLKGTKRKIQITAEELHTDLEKLKKELVSKKEASEMFGQEKQKGSLAGIIGDIFQTAFKQDVYQTLEEKAANLLYFIIKNHPFTDGNKRSAAFSFIWFFD